MRLTTKFILALVFGVALVAFVQGIFDYRREREVFDLQMRAEARTLGLALSAGVEAVWFRDGQAAALQFIEAASKHNDRIKVRFVWLDSTTDKPRASKESLVGLAHGDVVMLKDSATNFMLTYVPIDTATISHVPVPGNGAIEIAQPLADIDKYTRDSLRNQILGSIGEVAIAAALALLLGVVFIGRPISRLAAKARRVGTGDLGGPLHLSQRDELGELANEINLMCDRLADERGARERATDQLRHADRLTTVGKLASGLAHELGTPLNVVSGRARLIASREVEGQEAVDSARIVLEQSERMTALIRQLLDFARPRALEKASINVPALAARTCELVGTIARKANVTLSPPPADDTLRVDADDGQLGQVLTNLVVNAIQAMPDGGTCEIRVRLVDQVPPAYVKRSTRAQTKPSLVALADRMQTWMAIDVRDTGIGMDDETRARIFEPFFTTKPVGEGTGLGLSVTWGIVREHGGWIDVSSQPDEGSTFTVYLPSKGAA
jgi:signal transduction histidine kinase